MTPAQKRVVSGTSELLGARRRALEELRGTLVRGSRWGQLDSDAKRFLLIEEQVLYATEATLHLLAVGLPKLALDQLERLPATIEALEEA